MWLFFWARVANVTRCYICFQQNTSFWLVPPHVTMMYEWYHFSHLFILTYLMRHLYSVRPWPLITFFSPSPLLSFISLSKTQPFNPACLYGHIHSWVSWKSTPSSLQIHANHITASKSSGASSETELCTCENWTTERGRCVCRGVVVHPSFSLLSPTMFMSWFSSKDLTCSFKLVQFGSVWQCWASQRQRGEKRHMHFRKIKYCVCDPGG